MFGVDPSLFKILNIYFHERGNSEILIDTNSIDNLWINFPTSGA